MLNASSPKQTPSAPHKQLTTIFEVQTSQERREEVSPRKLFETTESDLHIQQATPFFYTEQLSPTDICGFNSPESF